MAALTAMNPMWIQSMTKRTLNYQECLVDGSTTYKAGEFLRINSSGLVVECSDSAGVSYAANAITHYALTTLGTVTGNSTTKKLYGVVHEDDIWYMSEKALAVDASMQGQCYGMDVSSNLCTVDTSLTAGGITYTVLQVLSLGWYKQPFQTVSTDTLGRLSVQILSAAIHATPAA